MANSEYDYKYIILMKKYVEDFIRLLFDLFIFVVGMFLIFSVFSYIKYFVKLIF